MLIASIAVASDPHWAGIDATQLPLLQDIVFVEPACGFVARLENEPDARVRVTISSNIPSSVAVFEGLAASLDVPAKSLLSPAEHTVGSPHEHVVLRDRNLVVDVRRPAGAALELAEVLFSAAEIAEGWPADPKMGFDGTTVTVEGVSTHRVTVPSTVAAGTFLPSPVVVAPINSNRSVLSRPSDKVRVVAWDKYGRCWGRAMTIRPGALAVPAK
jgi:hypothetical protein